MNTIKVGDVVKVDGQANAISMVVVYIDSKSCSARIEVAEKKPKWSSMPKVVPIPRLVKASEVPGCIEHARAHL